MRAIRPFAESVNEIAFFDREHTQETEDKPLTKNSVVLGFATISACRISLMTTELLDSVLLQTGLPELKLHASGKVRDVYNLDADSFSLLLPTAFPRLIMCWQPVSRHGPGADPDIPFLV